MGIGVVRRLWLAFDASDWHTVRSLLHPDFEAEWPQTAERFDRDGYVRVNETYPGTWTITPRRAVADGDIVVSEAFVEHSDPERTTYVVGFYKLEGELIRRAVEYWPAPGEPAPERA